MVNDSSSGSVLPVSSVDDFIRRFCFVFRYSAKEPNELQQVITEALFIQRLVVREMLPWDHQNCALVGGLRIEPLTFA